MQRFPWGRGLELAVAMVAVVGGIFGIAAFFVARRANQIAAAGAYPHLAIVSAKSLEFALPASNTAQYYFCRTEMRIVNTGGVSTSIIGLQPLGDFNDRGFLPSLKREGLFNVQLHGIALLPVLVTAILSPGQPLLLLDPLIRAITHSAKLTYLQGPFPYALAITNKGGAGLLPTKDQAASQGPATAPIRSLSDIHRLLNTVPGTANSTAKRLFDLMLPAAGPAGLPRLIPANSAQDLAIDFEATFPPGVDLFSAQSSLARDKSGLNLHVGYLLKFPDAPPLRIAPTLCGLQPSKDELAAIQQLFKDQGWPISP